MSVFLGWMPGEDALPVFASLQRALASALPADTPRHHWRSPRQWHMTLFHLGDGLADGMAARIDAAVAAIAARTPAIPTRFETARYWPGASVLVAKLHACDALLGLFAQTCDAMTPLGFAGDRRKPNPHVTLAYVPKGSRPSALPELPAPVLAPIVHVDRIALLRTAPGGYDMLASWPLLPATEAA